MEQKLLSVSIAAYNAAWCLSECIESFLMCNNKNWIELIVVNDGSTDETLKIAEKYQFQYPQIVRVIDKQNGGHGSTVNAAIEASKGKYFKVVDSDDTVDVAGLNDLMCELRQTNADILLSPYYQVNVKNQTRKIQNYWPSQIPVQQYTGKDMDIEKVFLPIRLAMHAITYKTELLKKNQFRLDENCFYVDTEYTMGYLQDIKAIRFTTAPVYNYNVGFKTQSVERTNMFKRIDQFSKVANTLVDYYKNEQSNMNEAQKELFRWNFCDMLLLSYYQLLLLHKDSKKAKQMLINLEKRIKEVSEELYESIPEYFKNQNSKLSFILPLLRKQDYKLFNIIHFASSIFMK